MMTVYHFYRVKYLKNGVQVKWNIAALLKDPDARNEIVNCNMQNIRDYGDYHAREPLY